jgi:hypothetical protein
MKQELTNLRRETGTPPLDPYGNAWLRGFSPNKPRRPAKRRGGAQSSTLAYSAGVAEKPSMSCGRSTIFTPKGAFFLSAANPLHR